MQTAHNIAKDSVRAGPLAYLRPAELGGERQWHAGAECDAALLALAIVVPGCAADSGPANLALWRIVDQGCNASPATVVTTAQGIAGGLACEHALGYAVLKDRCGPTHFLVIPTARRSGVESTELQSVSEPDYFAFAWRERSRSTVARNTIGSEPSNTRDAGDIGLAVNSRYGRSQAQLHIHIDFLRPDVRAALRALPPELAPGTRLQLMGHWYRVAHVDSLARSPFIEVAGQWQAADEEERARLTIAVVSDGDRGFYILSDRADPAGLDRGHAEELLVPRSCY